MRCSECGTETAVLDGYQCQQCGKWTCLEHRMRDKHHCSTDLGVPGIEVKSIMDSGGKKPVEPARDAPKNIQPPAQKRKRFGLF